ncbi:hypothetical protein SAMN02583745_02762 [Thorsellia anophelis DSM 18579]|uniref:Uncharacterized protein n=2 Tax=Thorsellia anophelis TaxID=336804 RepID=A0A1I0FGL8_9GAMM|nr:hypothetical protein SAMN02583745_02762 [Thorsellia anophelis DSM 18579]
MNDEGGINYNKEYQTSNSGDSSKEKDADQYLGHWNQDGFLMAPLSYWGTSKQPILNPNITFLGYDGNITPDILERPNALYYCVRNSTYQEWRDKHNAGGDLVSFSNMVEILLSRPFTIRF